MLLPTRDAGNGLRSRSLPIVYTLRSHCSAISPPSGKEARRHLERPSRLPVAEVVATLINATAFPVKVGTRHGPALVGR